MYNLVLIVLSLFFALSQSSAIPASDLEQRDLVRDVVLLLEVLRASSFCSSFAPQSTVILTSTATTSQTTTVTTMPTVVNVLSETTSTTATVYATQTIIVDLTQTIEATNTDTLFVTSTSTVFSTVPTTTTVTTNIVENAPGRRVKRGKPAELLSYADNIVTSACHSYIKAPTSTASVTRTSTITSVVTQTQTSTSTITAATITLTNTLPASTTTSSTTSTTATADISVTESIVVTQTVPTTVISSTATTTYTYSIATAGTGCGDIVYYNSLQDYVVTTEQCLDYCSSMPNCKAVMLQCSASEPCECTVNDHQYQGGDLQCGLPTQYYGEFTLYNKIS